jgi:hypothetical protein
MTIRREAVSKPHRIEVPEGIRSLAMVTDPDSTYACEITTADDDRRSAEQWARSVFEDAPRFVRWCIVTGWLVGLRLRLASRSSPAHVLGWTAVSSSPQAIVLGVESFALTARLVVRVQDGQVIHATFVRYERRVGGSCGRPPSRSIAW